MYVVRRAFRNYGNMLAPGSVVEPDAIKHFKSRLRDGRIVEVTEQSFDKWEELFRVRYGVALKLPKKHAVEPVKTTALHAKAKPVIKATVK